MYRASLCAIALTAYFVLYFNFLQFITFIFGSIGFLIKAGATQEIVKFSYPSQQNNLSYTKPYVSVRVARHYKKKAYRDRLE